MFTLTLDDCFWAESCYLFSQKHSVGYVRLGSKYTFHIQTFERKIQHEFVSGQNKLLANSFLQRMLLALQQQFFVKS